MANVNVTIDGEAMGKLNNAMQTALVKTGTEMLSRLRNDAVMPMDTGALQNEDTTVDDSGAASGHIEIVTNAPQARRLYFNPQYDFRTDHNANAGGEWWEPFISGKRKDDPKQIFGAFLKQDAGEIIK
jgi:hypothetical protein